jgi:GAF domain-containing protein
VSGRPTESDRATAEEVQAALYRIAELASAAHDMQEFYAAIHEVVGELMYAKNLFIALYDEERQLISWPYAVDEVDHDWPDPNQWVAFSSRDARGTTGYVLRTGKPQLLPRARQKDLIGHGEIELIGELSEDWLGVPLKSEERTVGVLVVQSYVKDVRYTEQDKDLLAFVGQHVGAALSRARAIEETRQRNAELALINSVQEAIAGELDQQAIYDAVGDRIREIFDVAEVFIAIPDDAARLMRFPYFSERGERSFPEPKPLEGGFTTHVIETRETLMINEDLDTEVQRYGSSLLGEAMPKSILYVPLDTAGRATGVVCLASFREHEFGESDRQLLETLAASLSVALENARLVHETRQRNAELALINSVQEAIAGELEQQAIYDAVGDRIQEIFDAQGTAISIYDEATGLLSFPYLIERGERLWPGPRPISGGFTKHVIETREPVLINEDMLGAVARYDSVLVAGEMEKSALFVPLLTGADVRGSIALSNFDREHAFSESDQRLLTTLAASLSVALENARLVHETRQRNAELALINGVQEAIAGELDAQAIYDAVGDRIQEIFDAQAVAIFTLDDTTGLMQTPYMIERGERLSVEPRSPVGFSKHVMETRESVLLTENVAVEAERYGSPVAAGEAPKSVLFVPLVTAGSANGVISLQNVDREHAFGESDRQLLETLAGSLSVALENARLVHETRQRNAELALINSVQEAIAGELDQQAIYDAVGDKIQEIFDAQVVAIDMLDQATGLVYSPYTIERGERLQDEPRAPRGFAKHVLETREPVLVAENIEAEVERFGSGVSVGEAPKSVLFVPLVTGGKATGAISLQNIDREHAFGQSDLQLLETLAGSLSVALENARLVHETRQRNAELALISGVQEAIAGELETQAIYDAVGDRIRDVFDVEVVQISMLEEATGLLHDRYLIERGERLDEAPWAPAGFSKHILETREPLLIVENLQDATEQYASEVVEGSEVPMSVLFVPLVVSGKATGVISRARLQRVGRTAARDACRQPERRAGERAARARDAAAECRAGVDQQRAGGDRR